jgi:hypothetical protein
MPHASFSVLYCVRKPNPCPTCCSHAVSERFLSLPLCRQDVFKMRFSLSLPLPMFNFLSWERAVPPPVSGSNIWECGLTALACNIKITSRHRSAPNIQPAILGKESPASKSVSKLGSIAFRSKQSVSWKRVFQTMKDYCAYFHLCLVCPRLFTVVLQNALAIQASSVSQ